VEQPPPTGHLTPEQLNKAQAWLSAHWINSACPFHGLTTWEVGGVLAQAMAYVGGGLVVGGPVYPFLVVTCSHCGYSVLVNALKIGIVQPEQPVQSPELPPATTAAT
jgi:hypothetical protein